jgi:hypothetical protein
LKTHRFTVNVPNATEKAAVANLSLEAVTPAKLAGLSLNLPGKPLKVLRAMIALDPCGERPAGKRIVVKLRPRSSVDVHVLIDTESARGADGAAAIHLVDRRAGGQKGGVMLIVTHKKPANPAAQTVAIANACPVVLAGTAYPVALGDDPGQRPASSVVTAGTEFELVAPVTNPTGKSLADVRVYLEHVGTCDADFRPATWNIGELKPKAVFYAAWRVKARAGQSGTFKASVVAVSRRANPVRLSAQMRIDAGRRGKDSPAAKRPRGKTPVARRK